MIQVDILIVGAGPAGSFAAELLARRGVKVGLFDGRPPGEPKACGGGVTAKALKAWPTLLNAVGRELQDEAAFGFEGEELAGHLQPFRAETLGARDAGIVDAGILRQRFREAGEFRVAVRRLHLLRCHEHLRVGGSFTARSGWPHPTACTTLGA